MARAAGIAVRATTLQWILAGVFGQTNPTDLLPDFLTFPLQDVAPGAQASDDLFTIFFVADSEPRMRANTDEEVKRYINNLVSYKTSREEYFSYGGGRHRLAPQLVILAGDISADRETSIAADAHLWQPLMDHGIAFLAGFGNHDWTQTSYDFSGDSWNAKATEFCRETYRNATRVAAPYFGYREFGPSDSRGPVTSVATFRGVQIVNFNSFLYQPSYHYNLTAADPGSGQSCATANALSGFAGCEVFTSAEQQIQRLEAELAADSGVTALFVQHFPLTTEDRWWQDFGASGTSVAQKKERLKGLIERYSSAALLAGHSHDYARVEHSRRSSPTPFVEYIAPYFGGRGGADLNQGGGFLALLVSRTQGIVEVKHIPTPLYDPSRTTRPMTTRIPTTTTMGFRPTDLSILGRVTSKEQAQACIIANCISEAMACSGNSQCSSLATPLLVGSTADRQQLAQLLWSLALVAPGNSVVRDVASCADRSCGSAILSSSGSASTSLGPALRGTNTTTPSARTSSPPTTTWNPWVAVALGGCQSQGDGAAWVATAALVAMASAWLP